MDSRSEAGNDVGDSMTTNRKAPMSTGNRLSDAAPRVENLAQMLQFQDKAVVSRMLVKNAGGSVTLFAFDAGEGLSEHTAPFDALLIGVEGRADILLGGEHHTLGAGETLLMPANVPHAVTPLEPFKMVLVMLRSPADAAK
jgi:quercetin dioxygenase-like cupin family protein